MSYLNFVDTGTSASGKTRMWDIVNTVGENLGNVRWYSHWRKYVAQLSGAYDPDCLNEIATFIRTKTEEHRDAKNAG